MNPRIKNVIAAFNRHKIDGLIVTTNENITYLTGFPASESWLLVTPKKTFYVTDFRYILAARKGLKGIMVKQYTQSPYATIFQLVKECKVKRLGFDERHFSVAEHKKLIRKASKGIKIKGVNELVEEIRAIKTSDELYLIRKALGIHREALRNMKRWIKPGLSEQDLLDKLERFVKAKKVTFSFDPIIAAGPNSCFPHATVTKRKIRRNDVVLVDMGFGVEGYKSDLTRMFFLGKIPKFVQEVNALVELAQKQAINKIREGVRAADIDFQARNYLEKHRLAKYFGHSLGHGVGLEIHENPRLSQKSNTVLKAGMVVTVEPAVYIPHKFGIRIEDMVLVKKKGCEILSGNIHH